MWSLKVLFHLGKEKFHDGCGHTPHNSIVDYSSLPDITHQDRSQSGTSVIVQDFAKFITI
jgi:hypothetical protein